ncbi:hypothetical protein [Rhodococcus globerulus]|uniref:Uncharacterized protein n=1 Tax=Rhodococcus globerulus TaxID=33008 RepID=A0ABU4BS58_RHOGO|nr:hypothetical protein [Rhodococcus globerulus]MDV6267050.1 hypothetical protein [Rhodococcus globerulus]
MTDINAGIARAIHEKCSNSGRVPDYFEAFVSDVLAELHNRGRLVPEGGLPLTAEVESDVRAVLDWVQFHAPLGNDGRNLRAAYDRLREGGFGSVPATEPAEELKPCGYCNSTDATLLRSCTNCGAIENDPWGVTKPAKECQNDNHDPGCGCGAQHWMTTPAPAVPAEEETKADPFEALHNAISFSSMDFGSASDVAWIYGIVVGWDNDNPDEGEHPYAAMRELAQRFNWPLKKVQLLRSLRAEWVRRTSSPVVPAPTEPVYVNVPTWQEVPEGITYQGEGKAVRYVNRDGQPYNLGSSKPLSDTFEYVNDYMRPQGPFYFVPASTETEWPTWDAVPEGVPYREKNSIPRQWWRINRDGKMRVADIRGETILHKHAQGPFVAAGEGDA